MTEYTAQCRASDRDKFVASRSDDAVRVEAVQRRDFMMDAFLDPGTAREFAAGLVALADEIEGEDVPDIKVGDHVEIVTYRTHDDEYNGRRGVVTSIDTDDIPYLVRFDGEDDYTAAYAREVRKVDPPRAVKVGDRLRVTKNRVNAASVRVGMLLTVTRVDSDGGFYTDDGPSTGRNAWIFHPGLLGNGLEFVDDPDPVPNVPIVSVRADYVTQAKALLSDTPHTGADVVAMAAYLAG
ncbi:hypothetical protein [Streptomyces sp. NPDC006638]|uniref:hypothetical protein n=1 Tax=Streptomyces sp. NPDC006638 TaxID=3157183 RepID=UPI0033B543AA